MQDTLCFQDKLELELALNDYLLDRNPDTDVAESYGWPINAWCVDNVQDFSFLFSPTTNVLKASFQERLSGWNMHNALSVESMFEGNEYFDQDLSSWNLSKCDNFNRMFFGATNFRQDLCRWSSFVPESANVMQLFRGTNCPAKADPILSVGGPWCFECTNVTSVTMSMSPTSVAVPSNVPTSESSTLWPQTAATPKSPAPVPSINTPSPISQEQSSSAGSSENHTFVLAALLVAAARKLLSLSIS